MTDLQQRKIFGENLNYFITLKGKPQGEVADDLDVPRTTFNTWCVGKVIPGMRMLCVLADYFDCTISDLVNKHGEAYNEQYQFRKLAEQEHDVQFLRRMLAYAKFLKSNPEDN